MAIGSDNGMVAGGFGGVDDSCLVFLRVEAVDTGFKGGERRQW